MTAADSTQDDHQHHNCNHGHHNHDAAMAMVDAVLDPVCGMTVNPATARYRTEHAGAEFYFCGARCLEQLRVALDSMLSRVALAREVIITSSGEKVRDGRLVDETSLGFACGAVEALLREISLWRMAENLKE